MRNMNDEGIVELCNQVIGGHAVGVWDKRWLSVPRWWLSDSPELRRARGLVRLSLRGEVMAIARASDNRRGFAKKFSDYVRPSPSSRDHHMGRLIHDNRHDLVADIIITGENSDMERVNIALKRAMVKLYRPVWSASERM